MNKVFFNEKIIQIYTADFLSIAHKAFSTVVALELHFYAKLFLPLTHDKYICPVGFPLSFEKFELKKKHSY